MVKDKGRGSAGCPVPVRRCILLPGLKGYVDAATIDPVGDAAAACEDGCVVDPEVLMIA